MWITYNIYCKLFISCLCSCSITKYIIIAIINTISDPIEIPATTKQLSYPSFALEDVVL